MPGTAKTRHHMVSGQAGVSQAARFGKRARNRSTPLICNHCDRLKKGDKRFCRLISTGMAGRLADAGG
jgi:hypothetical protein